MNIWHITDSHGYHNQYILPKNIDVVIFSGDESNKKSPELNEQEFFDFLYWFENIPIKHKIFVAGNHSTFIFKTEKYAKKLFDDKNITYLNKSSVVIDGYKIYGDPITPEFFDWAFMGRRDKLHKHWGMIDEDVDILVTHGPPWGILDSTDSPTHRYYEHVGCKALRKKVESLEKLKLHCFGHIHSKGYLNSPSILKINNILFSNASGVEDGKFDKGLIYNGNVITI